MAGALWPGNGKSEEDSGHEREDWKEIINTGFRLLVTSNTNWQPATCN